VVPTPPLGGAASLVGSSRRAAPAVEVERPYGPPADRRNGVARLLISHAHRHAADNGFQRLVLDVLPSRTQATKFYRQLGYAEFAAASGRIIRRADLHARSGHAIGLISRAVTCRYA
jgi:GNAT superfamily N-acetyltransferase